MANTAFADWLKKHANGKEIASFVSDSDHLSLGELCSKVTDGSHSSPRNDPNGKYPMLSVRDMRRFGFDYASCKMISQIDFDAMTANDCVPKVDDILVAKDGSYLKEVFITNEEKNEAVLSSIAIFRPDKRIIAPEILLYFLKHPRTRKLVADNFVSGSALPRIVLKDFKKLTLLTPSRKEQEEILPILQIVRNLTWANVKGNERLVKLRDTLLPKLMSGEIDVSKVDPTQLNSHLVERWPSPLQLQDCRQRHAPTSSSRDNPETPREARSCSVWRHRLKDTLQGRSKASIRRCFPSSCSNG